MESVFSRTISEGRREAKLTQNEECTKVRKILRDRKVRITFTQATLSAWESGRQHPSQKMLPVVEAVADVLPLTVDKKTLLNLVTTHHLFRQGRRPDVSETQYLRDASSFIKSNNHNIDIWIVGPTRLPIVVSEEIRQTWVINLRFGVNYNIIWILDLLDDATLSAITETLAYISETLDKSTLTTSNHHGKITHYLTSLSNPDRSQDEIRSRFKLLLPDLGSDLTQFRELSEPLPAHLRDRFLLDGLGIATLVLYKPRSLSVTPIASIALRDVRRFLADEKHREFLWLENEQAQLLRSSVTSFEKYATEKRLKSKSRK
jgi:transcriptional regulator with XRE-family HTH domain